MTVTGLHPAEALDAWLDAQDAGGPGTAARRAAERDRNEEFPEELCQALDAFGLHSYYVPAELGGSLDDHEVLFHLWRAVARRDLSAMVAHGKTYLGAVCTWIVGDEAQARALAAKVTDGARVSWALSEPEHGADLLAGDFAAATHPGGYRLDGTKWPVNNATRGTHLTVLARTGKPGSSRGHSLFLVDKAALAPGSHRPLPKASTHGIRGVDISGIVLEGAVVAPTARIGAEGAGTETVLRALQLTRTLCTALSTGAGEHALRLVTAFAAERVIQGRPLIERPNIRSVLARCAGLVMATEAASLMASRSVHALTGEMSVVSAVAKALAPTLVDAAIAELAEVLGSRAFLSEEYAHGAFQKVQRDHQVVAVFDGATVVNRNALVLQFPRLVHGFATGVTDVGGLAAATDLTAELPRLDWGRGLTLLSRGGCSTVQALPATIDGLAAHGAPAALLAQGRTLLGAADELHRCMAEIRPSAHPPMAAYELAAGYELVYAASTCLQLWTANADTHADEPMWRDARWLRVALAPLLARLQRLLGEAPSAAADGHQVDDEFIDTLAEAVAQGATLTPFGRPVRTTEADRHDH